MNDDGDGGSVSTSPPAAAGNRKKHYVELLVQGRQSQWGVSCWMSQGQMDAMAKDGIDIGILHHIIPEWVVACGLMRPWCFVEDLLNFRNPFK